LGGQTSKPNVSFYGIVLAIKTTPVTLHAFQNLGSANVPPSMNQTGFLETGKPIKLTLDVNLTGVIYSKSDLTTIISIDFPGTFSP